MPPKNQKEYEQIKREKNKKLDIEIEIKLKKVLSSYNHNPKPIIPKHNSARKSDKF